MTLPDDCPHGLPEPAWCSICRDGPQLSRPSDINREVTITARHGGHCDWCERPIDIGDPITMWSDGRWRHEECEA